MEATIEQLRQVMLEAGVDPQIAAQLRANEPLLTQGIDSLDFPAFALAVESHYAIRIEDHDLFGLRTLNDFAAFISQKSS